MHIQRFVCNMVSENCYLLWDDTLEAALIDCGALYPEEQQAITQFIEENHLKLTHLFNTHGHFDHIFGANFIYRTYGIKIELCEAEKATYEQAIEQMRAFIHADIPFELAPVGHFFKNGDVLSVGHISLRVIATPGHTPGGVCFYDEEHQVLFSGDSLFQHEIGRCDLPGGSKPTLIESLKSHILTLPIDVKVLPGHGGSSTIGEEQISNLYLR